MSSATDLLRFRPTHRTLAALGSALWLVSFGAVREFVWAELREGMIRLTGLSRATQAIIWLGFLLIAAMTVTLLQSDVWRAQSPLISLPTAQAMRGTQVPAAFIPATLLVLSIGWSFALAGALHSHVTMRLFVLLLYALPTVRWISEGDRTFTNPTLMWLSWAALAAVPLFFLVRARFGPRPALEFATLLLLVATTYAPTHVNAVQAWRIHDDPASLRTLHFQVAWLFLLTQPFVYYLGVDIADSIGRIAGWTANLAGRLPVRAVVGGLALVLGWRVTEVLLEVRTDFTLRTWAGELLRYLGALGVPASAALCWWLSTRWRRTPVSVEEIAAGVQNTVLPLILAYEAIQILEWIVSGVVVAWPFPMSPMIDLQARRLMDSIADAAGYWPMVAESGAIALGLWLAWRGQPAVALFLTIFGSRQLYVRLTNMEQLAWMSWYGFGPVDFWWVMLILFTGAFWWRRRRLTSERAMQLAFLVMITGLIRRVNLIDEPLGPFFAGVGLIAFGTLWDVLTGGTWANASSAAFPRTSRILLYLGYVLFSLAIINWAFVARNDYQMAFLTETGVQRGFDLFGKPILYAIMLVTLLRPAAAAAADAGTARGS